MSAPIQQLLLTASHPIAGTEAAAFLARTSGLNSPHSDAYINLINGLVADSLWSKFDALYIFATQDSTTAALNLISSTYNATVNGSPTFTADRGFTGADSSSTQYINTGFNPSTASSPNYVQNSAHISAWSNTDFQSSNTGGIVIGLETSVSANRTNLFPKFGDGKSYFRVNNNTGNSGVTCANSKGHYVANRSGSSALQGYQNATSVLSDSSASSAVVNGNMAILAINQGGSITGGGAYQLTMASIGSSLSGTDVTNFYNRLRTYMTAVGVP